jgi:hypothetical protein
MKKGYKVSIVQEPETGLAADVEATLLGEDRISEIRFATTLPSNPILKVVNRVRFRIRRSAPRLH